MKMIKRPKNLFRGYLLDLDGTVYLGDSLLPGALDTIQTLRNNGQRVLFVSNNPTRSPTQTAEKLTRLGLSTSPLEILTSTQVLIRILKQRGTQGGVFVLGEAPLLQALREAGFHLVEEAAHTSVVVASFDRTFDYRKLQIGFDALRRGAAFVASNADRYCPVPGGGEPDAAAIIAALEACADRKVEMVAGKPSIWMVEAALERMGITAENCLIVGDRLETDIQMGRNSGIAAALVLSGATSDEDLSKSTIIPDYVIDNLGQLLPD